MSNKFETTWFYAPLETRTESRPSGFLGLSSKIVDVPEGKVANLEEFSEQLANIYNGFDEKGYDVVNVVPISMGSSESCHSKLSNGQKNYLGETGFSITRGAVVVGKKRE
ncbi:hypothetical protein [Shewanella woodyi]|uniref:hypothetical protein n=1 Tax=Shewanella woodyi TaxID=60961 RepID=UPI0007F90FEE|nr:hypothetical protein [Shewanella woodyi]